MIDKREDICDFCGLTTNNHQSFLSHLTSCNIVKSNIDDILTSYNNGVSLKSIIYKYKISYGLMSRILDKNSIKRRSVTDVSSKRIGKPGTKHTEETKRKLSIIKKEYLMKNPDKHNWKSSDKFKSVPCENFKKIIDEMGINYIPEMSISNERHFSIDIAIPEYKIGIEINGNQHYNKDGTLKEYYQKRHDYIKSFGWTLFEIHYSECFNNDNIRKLINNILSCKKEIHDYNYDEYIRNKLNKRGSVLCECGNKKSVNSIKCQNCSKVENGIIRRKVNRPENAILRKEVDENGYSKTGRKYGVSDNAIRKWIKSYESFTQ